MNRYAFVFPLVVLCSMAAAANDGGPNYGTAAETAYVVAPFDLDPANSTVGFAYFNGGRYSTTGGGDFFGGVMLPAGSSVARIELDACDNSSTGEVRAFFNRCASPFNGCLILGQAFTGVAFTDGGACGTFSAVVAPAHTIDNENNVYLVQAANAGTFTSSTRINAVRIYYKLQVSTAPAVATFGDVPTGHPFFRFVEALTAAGITGGCSPAPNPNFCPDTPVTRGQMAVFLSSALGLHWAP